MSRAPRPLTEAERLAARLSRLPGVSLAEACRRTGVSPGALRRARAATEAEAWPSREDLLLAALTRAGVERGGEVGELGHLAAWMDWQNHDGTTADEVRAMLDGLAERGLLELTGG